MAAELSRERNRRTHEYVTIVPLVVIYFSLPSGGRSIARTDRVTANGVPEPHATISALAKSLGEETAEEPQADFVQERRIVASRHDRSYETSGVGESRAVKVRWHSEE